MEISKKIRKVATIGMGIALFVVLSMLLKITVFENYYLCAGYIAMAIFLYSFGVVSGTIVGTVGTILYCILISGLRGMPGWAIGNVLIGIILGLEFKGTKKLTMSNKNILAFIIEIVSIVGATALGILLAKSFVEMVLYSQTMLVRIAKNTTAFISDVLILIIALPICKIVDKRVKKIE